MLILTVGLGAAFPARISFASTTAITDRPMLPLAGNVVSTTLEVSTAPEKVAEIARAVQRDVVLRGLVDVIVPFVKSLCVKLITLPCDNHVRRPAGSFAKGTPQILSRTDAMRNHWRGKCDI
jgi:hypothetical protein